MTGTRGLRAGDIVTVPAPYRSDRRTAVVESVAFDGLTFADTTGFRHRAADAGLVPLAGVTPAQAPPRGSGTARRSTGWPGAPVPRWPCS